MSEIDNSINLDIADVYLPIIADGTKKIFGYRGGRGGGKSYGICDALIARCLRGEEVCYAGRITKSANDLSITQIFKRRLDNLFCQSKQLESIIRVRNEYIEMLKTKSVIKFVGFSDKTIDNITSSSMSMAWVDECHGISKYTIDRLIPSVRLGNEQRIIFSYNPQLINDPISVFLNSRDDGAIYDVNFCDNPFFKQNVALVAELREDYRRLKNKTITEGEFNHRWFGKPYFEGENLLLPYELVQRTMEFKSYNYLNYNRIMGVDVATENGSDFSVIAIRQGNKIIDIIKLKGLDGLSLAQEIIKYKNIYKVISIFIDETGVGHSPCDFLKRQFNCAFTPVNFGSGSNNDKYANLKTEVYYKFRKAVEEGLDISIENTNDRLQILDELVDELQYIPITVLDNGKIRMTKKSYIRDVLGHSPDVLDAIVFTYAYQTNDLIINPLNAVASGRSRRINLKWD